MCARYKSLAALVAFAGLACILASEASAQQRYRLEGDLWPSSLERRASGKARFEYRLDRVGRLPRMKFSAECEDLLRTTTINVHVNGRLVGVAKVDAEGVADLNLDTDLGDTVPQMFNNDRVEIFNAAGDPIMKGVLRGSAATTGSGTR